MSKRIIYSAVIGIVCIIFMFAEGCSGIEPEKRMYPLALGIDRGSQGFHIVLSMPNLPAATGQGKQEEGGSRAVLAFDCTDFEDFMEQYNRTQEKYLDLGHLQVLVLGKNLQESNAWKEVFSFLKEEAFVGEDIYLFSGENVDDILSFGDTLGTSTGEYLVGIYENRPKGDAKKGVTLRDAYLRWYEEGKLPPLPALKLNSEKIWIEEKE